MPGKVMVKVTLQSAQGMALDCRWIVYMALLRYDRGNKVYMLRRAEGHASLDELCGWGG